MAQHPDGTQEAVKRNLAHSGAASLMQRCACKRRRGLVLDADLENWLRFIDPSGAFLARYGQRIAEHFDSVDQFKEYKRTAQTAFPTWEEGVKPSLFRVLDIRLADRPVLARAILVLQ